ncbi:MAG: hypothetical protein OXJ53_19215 [Gammaproteobacteria bacterium]|nr:hypothetical protein [Gammaproteobacteria bacterium]MDD9962337.1 hypothetical protein [Gammaproteobacteria bacterium]MDE0272520.1 hypothetical protein [Gammaproteobacteria bacterium]
MNVDWGLQADVVVLGSGGAALTAALAAHDFGAGKAGVCRPRLNLLLSSPTAPLRSWINETRGEKTALGAVFSCLMRVNAPIEARDQDNSLH